jgi:fibronectin type 3 domain-containing protein
VVAAHSVTLTWDAPVSSPDPVAGFNVYRTSSGGTSYQLLNTGLDSLTTYVDYAVQSGLTYTYLVRSVDAQGVESAPSNTTTATIP